MGLIWAFIKLIFWLIVFGSFLYTFLSHFLLWVDLRLNYVEDHRPTPSAWVLLRSFVLEFVYVFLNCLLYPLGFIKQKAELHQSQSTPILFIHGYGHNQLCWYWFMQQFKKQGVSNPLYALNLLPPFTSITRYAEQIQKKIQEIKAQTGNGKVILVGHSMGGLIASYYAENLALPGEVLQVIALGSPFEGTKTAVLGIGENAREMQPTSDFLKSLTEKVAQSRIPYFVVASQIDNLIIPWQSAQLAQTPDEKTFIVNTDGHFGLLFSTPVLNQIIQWIKVA